MALTPKILIRAVVWAALATLLGSVLCATITATVAPLVEREPAQTLLMFWNVRFWSGIYVGGFVGGAALIPHSVLFTAWFAIRRNYPGIDSTLLRRAATSACLALPFSLVIFDLFLWVFPSAWVGILTPVALMRFLQWVPAEAEVSRTK